MSGIVAFRSNQKLQQQIETIAERDANSVSATIRRLLAAAIRAEQQLERRDAGDAR
jgi:hypothetical protein